MAQRLAQAPRQPPRDAGAVLAATKLHIPAPRHGLVPRRALVKRLTSSPGVRRLVLLAAPPGSGKTMLLSEWHRAPQEDRPFAWLSLDAADNDPVRFWSGVIEALRTVQSEVGGTALSAVRTSNVGLLDVVLPLLVNDLVALGQRLVLVLDDYHLISEPGIHESVGSLIDRLPETVELAVATRADPPLPLARYRARGELAEVRAGELRFEDEEAAALLNGALGLDLEVEDVARLQRRTEGWAAGLYLAALSLQGRTDVGGFIDSFAGDDRQVVDYLASEVLSVQPEELRDFLLRTSVLERLSGPLCDAVIEAEDSVLTLERMERSNLFLIPLDDTRDWYRYHQLFGELLRHELRRAHPEQVPELHRRAGAWYREQGSVPDAVHHAIAAGDVSEAGELVGLHWSDYFNQGRLETVSSWLSALPADEVRASPRLCVAGAWLSLDRGGLDEARDWIDAADAAVPAARRDNRAGSLNSDVAVLRAVHSFKTGDLGGTETAARRVLEIEPSGTSFPRVVAHTILGVALYWRGELDQAVETLRQAARLAEQSGNDLARAYVLGYLALAGGESLDLAEYAGLEEHFVLTIGHLARARTTERVGGLEEAERYARRAVELSGRGAGRLEVAASRLALSDVRHLLGDTDEARRLLREARQAIDGCPAPGTLAAAVRAAERGQRMAGHGPVEVEGLTDRELAVLRMLRGDLSRREIADALYVSLDTVKTHLRGIYRKLDATSREQAVTRARELGLI